jgi:hypothetical protein
MMQEVGRSLVLVELARKVILLKGAEPNQLLNKSP